MYTLILTSDERKAIDWIGDRYSHGYDLYSLLVQSYWITSANWDDNCDIEFRIPENIAWQIQEIGEECQYRWDCFAPGFAHKMNEFCDKIV